MLERWGSFSFALGSVSPRRTPAARPVVTHPAAPAISRQRLAEPAETEGQPRPVSTSTFLLPPAFNCELSTPPRLAHRAAVTFAPSRQAVKQGATEQRERETKAGHWLASSVLIRNAPPSSSTRAASTWKPPVTAASRTPSHVSRSQCSVSSRIRNGSSPARRAQI